MKITTNTILILFGIIGLAMIACLPVAMLASSLFQPTPSPIDPFATAQAGVTQTAMAVTQNAPIPTLIPATATPIPATNTPLPPATAVSYCDWVTFLKDVTVPDGTEFTQGETFTKTWRLKNRGTCTWTSSRRSCRP